MSFFDWNLLLFALKWVFAGLVYFVLILLLFGVQREMSLRLPAGAPSAAAARGSLRTLSPGQDPDHHPGLIIPLQPENRIGTATDNEIHLKDPYISGHHAVLRWDGAGWWVEDLNSRNGTYLNRLRLPPNQPQPVIPGAVLQMGDMIFELDI